MKSENKQVACKIKLAQRSNSLILTGCNLFKIPDKVWTLVDLLRLDLSFNNIDVLPPEVSNLTKLKELCLNDNPLRSIPPELSKCPHIRILDLSRTRIQTLPRDLAMIPALVELNLDRCPLKPSLQIVYERGIFDLWAHLKRKLDRRIYKEQVFSTLKESIYPGEDVRAIMELTLTLFDHFKDLNTEALKLFVHNLRRIFPEKMGYASPIKIREAFDRIQQDLLRRGEVSKLTVKLKVKYPQADIDYISKLALSLTNSLSKREIGALFKENLLPEDFDELDISTINNSLGTYKERQEVELNKGRINLTAKFKNLYQDEYAADEIERLSSELGEQFTSPERLRKFIQTADNFLPKNLGEFNSQTIKNNFIMTITKK
ncbi:unnamed protein product [Blepharisma stoltei]|uniref:Uncharacterized protein n=1 Tax=Blepharisma stoltei TaxID=1481888 RepID=A0AAU9J4D2_9CILI|nr:unnamed protein product [Blepharisma stoltei]